MLERQRIPGLLLFVAIVVAACAGVGPTSELTAVPINDFQTVAGNWAGPVTGISAQHDDWVEVVITPDGRYDFGIYRVIGVFGGAGVFTLTDGKLHIGGERGHATLSLLQDGADRWLKGQGVLADGRRVSVRLTAKK